MQDAAWPPRRRHCRGSGGRPHGAGCRESSASNHAPAVTILLEKLFWGDPHAGEDQVPGFGRLAVTVSMASSSTIQLVPTQGSAMCFGACVERRVQVMVRPWLIS